MQSSVDADGEKNKSERNDELSRGDLPTDAESQLNSHCLECLKGNTESPVVLINSGRTILESAFMLSREPAQKTI